MQGQNYPIKYWTKNERPREKLLSKNPDSLSDAELIAIILRCGRRQKSAVDLAREILDMGKGNLQELGKLSVDDITKVNGIGRVKAVTLLAALELGRRRQASISLKKLVVSDSHDVANYLSILLSDRKREVFGVIFLNRGNRINHFEILSEGGITGTVADIRVILKRALERDAVGLILCHNHPSGNLKPSRADQELTEKIREAARFFDIRILDHIIVSEEGYFSFADEGVL